MVIAGRGAYSGRGSPASEALLRGNFGDRLRRGDEELHLAVVGVDVRTGGHHPDAPQGRTFRVFACGYPAVPRSAEPEGGREADMEAT